MLHLSRGSVARVNRVAALVAKARKRVSWIIETVTWPLRAPFFRAINNRSEPLGITIGITTYKDRFDSCLKPLLPKVNALFPKEQVIVIANGHYRKEEQGRFLDRFNAFCSHYGRIMTVTYTDPVGLSRLWNVIISKAQYPKVLILNDDIMIRPGFRRLVKGLMTRNEPVVTVNGSWSHFLITAAAVESVGLFDEGLREIGGEDDDYLARMAIAGIIPGNIITSSVSGRSKRRMKTGGLNSYGRDMSLQAGGYSTLNTEYLLSKWETSDIYFEGAVEVPGRKTRYWKPRVAQGDKEK